MCYQQALNILIFDLRFMFYPKNVLSKVKCHIKVKITVVCLWNFDFKLDYKQRFTTKGWTETAIMLCKLNKSL